MILWLLIFSSSLWAKELSLMTLNLHGYHPTGEQRRIIQKAGKREISWSHMHYFAEEEIARGLQKRQALLASHIRTASPDILFLQEVGGADVHQKKTCADFYRTNTAQDLKNRLPDYKVWAGCRGNLGWWTDAHTFDGISIFKEKTQELVMTQGSNPYPEAMIMEGLAILTGPAVNVISHSRQTLSINSDNENFFLHLLKFKLTNQKTNDWWLAVNIHGGHMIQNFEQAVAARRFLSQFIVQQTDKTNFKGLIVAGDFNAYLPQEEVSTVPWSFFFKWQTKEAIAADLLKLNASDYKPFAQVATDKARARIQSAVEKLFDWFSWNRHPMDGSLEEVTLNSPCVPTYALMNPFCGIKEKIDHIFLSDKSLMKSHSALYKQNNWTDLENTTTDHPGLTVKLVFPD